MSAPEIFPMKKKTKKFKNPLVAKAKQRNSSGPMRSKKNKRTNGKNKLHQFQDENY